MDCFFDQRWSLYPKGPLDMEAKAAWLEETRQGTMGNLNNFRGELSKHFFAFKKEASHNINLDVWTKKHFDLHLHLHGKRISNLGSLRVANVNIYSPFSYVDLAKESWWKDFTQVKFHLSSGAKLVGAEDSNIVFVLNNKCAFVLSKDPSASVVDRFSYAAPKEVHSDYAYCKAILSSEKSGVKQ